MRVVVLHYHLRRGGVTSVITASATALAGQGVHTAAVCGYAPDQRLPFPVVTDPALGYDENEPPELLLERLSPKIRDALGGDPDLWHIHNHALGKNLTVPRLVNHLAAKGHHLLLHIHDFAEDFRPANYRTLLDGFAGGSLPLLHSILYPVAPQVFYATLTSRDDGMLGRSGIPAAARTVLANPAAAPRLATAPSRPAHQRHVVYPVRAIRRKNVGEFLLWSMVTPGDNRFLLTLPPGSPADIAPYEEWKRLAAEWSLPVDFEVGRHHAFSETMERADVVITTSIAEGFGLTYAEPWLMDKPLAGRRIDGVARDLEASGLDLSGLYNHLWIPLTWLDQDALRSRVEAALATLYGNGRLPVPDDATRRAWSAMTHEGRIDFGRLDEPHQASVLQRLAKDPAARKELAPASLPDPPDAAAISRNHAVVERAYGPHTCTNTLHALYERVAASPTGPVSSPGGELLTRIFLQPENLFLLRT